MEAGSKAATRPLLPHSLLLLLLANDAKRGTEYDGRQALQQLAIEYENSRAASGEEQASRSAVAGMALQNDPARISSFDICGLDMLVNLIAISQS
ncbi:unnamed protein product [Linum trigynum]|uniref:Uncharacterized protein n=1 Tax=Linum trigynum TaxID=586398 RepID=A0AAV2FVX8_9ROSI